MKDPEQFEPAFRQIIIALRPYLEDVVLIGGWVPFLYRKYGGFMDWRSRISRTGELDVLVIPPLATGQRPTLQEVLTNAGFRPVEQTGGAVWQAEPERGEVIEFLVPHEGTARQVGRVTSVSGQPGIGGIALPDLDLLSRYALELELPIAARGGTLTSIRIRVPTLGAYLTAKAATFFQRRQTPLGSSEDDSEDKRAKDLLYIRDLMAAGPDVTSRITSDLAELRKSKEGQSWVRYAANQLALLLRGRDQTLPDEAAAMLAERDSRSVETARADLTGHLTDAREMLAART